MNVYGVCLKLHVAKTKDLILLLHLSKKTHRLFTWLDCNRFLTELRTMTGRHERNQRSSFS